MATNDSTRRPAGSADSSASTVLRDTPTNLAHGELEHAKGIIGILIAAEGAEIITAPNARNFALAETLYALIGCLDRAQERVSEILERRIAETPTEGS